MSDTAEVLFKDTKPMRPRKIPKEILTPIVTRIQRERQCHAAYLATYDMELIRERCGSEWAGVPTDDVRRQCCNLRYAGHCGGVAPGPIYPEQLPSDMDEYYGTSEWEAKRKACYAFYGYRCAGCYIEGETLDAHHRTYVRFKHELPTDLIALWRPCHKLMDNRRRYSYWHMTDQPMLDYSEEE